MNINLCLAHVHFYGSECNCACNVFSDGETKNPFPEFT